MLTTMPTIGANLPHRLLNLNDDRLIDMLEGALFPPRRFPPRTPENDFLVTNLCEEITETANDAG